MKASASKQAPQILRLPAVIERTGLSRTTIYRLTDHGVPKPIKIGPNAVGWLEEDISAYLMARKIDSMQIH
jgi:prophage regulatory protein